MGSRQHLLDTLVGLRFRRLDVSAWYIGVDRVVESDGSVPSRALGTTPYMLHNGDRPVPGLRYLPLDPGYRIALDEDDSHGSGCNCIVQDWRNYNGGGIHHDRG